MSFFNKVFASIGIGSATVDTKLERDSVIPGEQINGVIEIRGGKVEQNIDNIYLTLNTTYMKESNDKKVYETAQIERLHVSKPLTLKPNDIQTIPFTISIPVDTPITYGRTKIWVATGLDIKAAIDPTDKDFLLVKPNSHTEAVLEAVANLGFRLREVECEAAPYHMRTRLPFIQEFEFIPVSGTFRGKLDELEIVFSNITKEETIVYMQIDRKAKGLGGLLAEALDIDESKVQFTVNNKDILNMKEKIFTIIQKYI